MEIIELIAGTLTQSFIYAFISFGMYITYKILDFPDMTAEGSFAFGAAVTAVCLTKGVNPYLTMLISIAAGALAGLCTGIIHVRLGVRDLIAGIITMTALFSINLQLAGANLSIGRDIDTIFTAKPTMAIFGGIPTLWRKLVISFILLVIFKFIIDGYLKTKNGLLLRAAGNNGTFVTSLAKDTGRMKIIGLVISNALIGFAGCLVCQEGRSFSSTIGTGQVVFGLATVIIGTTIFKRVEFVKGTTAVAIGSIIYKACIQIAISLGLPANLMKLETAILFLIILVIGGTKKKRIFSKGAKDNVHA